MGKYILWILLLFSNITISQNCKNTLSGTVTDLHDSSLLLGAVLIVAETGQAVETDFDGNYAIANLCNGSYTIQVSHPNCATMAYKVNIAGNTTKNLNLEHHLEELNQVLIQGRTHRNETKSILENTVSTKEIEQHSSESLGDVLNTISGVASLNTGNTIVKPMINGLHSSRVVIINNGVRMEDQEWGAEHAPNIDINTVDHLRLIKGAGALQYGGDAIGGVIIAETSKTPVKDTLYGKTLITSATNGRGGTISSQLTKSNQKGFYGTVQGSWKRFGDFEAPDYVLSNTGISQGNGAIHLGINRFNYGIEAYYSYFQNEIGILKASHLGGAQDLCRAIESDVPLVINDFTYDINAPKQNVNHHLARIKAFNQFGKIGKLHVQYDFQRNNRLEYDIRRGDDKDKASLDLQLDTHTLLVDLDSNLDNGMHLKTGIMAGYQNNFADANTGVRRLIPDYDKYDLGAYATADFKLNEAWTLEGGFRFDYTFMDVWKFYRKSFWESRDYDTLYPELVVKEIKGQVLTHQKIHFYNASSSLGTNITFGNHYNLFFNYSMASRAPNASELFSEGLHHSASRIELGDLSFQSEISHKILLTLQGNFEHFSFSINPYSNRISDYILIEPTGVDQTLRGSFQVWEYRQTEAQLLGVDIEASLDFSKHFHFNHQFSWLKGHDLTKDTPLISMPPASTTNEIVFQNPEFKNLRLALKSEYVFFQNAYPDNNFEIYIPQTGTYKTVDISTPPDAYHLMHFNASIQLNSKLTIGCSANNLFDTSYRNYLNRMRYYADDLGRNILVNIKINY